MQPPAIRYAGAAWGAPFDEREDVDATGRATRVRTALDAPLLARAGHGAGSVLRERPHVCVEHVRLPPGGTWTRDVPAELTAMLYVRSGAAVASARVVPAGSTALFERDGDAVRLASAAAEPCDALLLTGTPLGEPVALGGPIVMNTEAELRQAYSELRDGTFLDA